MQIDGALLVALHSSRNSLCGERAVQCIASLVGCAIEICGIFRWGTPDPECIICYRSVDEREAGSDDIFDLLSWSRILDTLPLTMRLGEALVVLEPIDIRPMYRGVVVSMQIVGAKEDEFPLRSVLPAIVFCVT